jgi:phosphoribosylformimino-5-aminoimidazole carboxamide ribotide isomerase
MITIIPAIDLIGGRCVRLRQGRFDALKEYDIDPLDVAREFEQHGCKRLHLVDLDGARQGKVVNHQVLEKIAASTKLVIDFSGGIRSQADLDLAFQCGAAQVAMGSIAVTRRALFCEWLEKYGSDKIILAADFYKSSVKIGAWSENTRVDLLDFLTEFRQAGIRMVICTDIEKDGLLQGPAVEMYRLVKVTFPDLFLIASGGVTTIKDVQTLNNLGVDGVIIGMAFYEGYIDLGELKKLYAD